MGQTANEVELCKRHQTLTNTLSHCFHVVTRHDSLMILLCLPTLRVCGKLTLLSLDLLPHWIGPNCIYGLDHWFKISGNCTFKSYAYFTLEYSRLLEMIFLNRLKTARPDE